MISFALDDTFNIIRPNSELQDRSLSTAELIFSFIRDKNGQKTDGSSWHCADHPRGMMTRLFLLVHGT
jgi:hypothetical protein